MGAAAHHRRAFLAAHPICAFCGGNAVATTIEHCPPRALFQFRQCPVDFEFPSCESCNIGTNNQDLIISMLARMDPFELKGDTDGKQLGLMKAVNRQFPGLFQKMTPSASEARRHNRELGLKPTQGQTHQEAGPVLKITSEIHQAVCVFAHKLSKGIYYRESNCAFPDHGCLLLNWFTNADIIRTGTYPVFDALKEFGGEIPFLSRGSKFLNDQFEYKLTISPNKDIFVLQTRVGHSFCFVVFGITIENKLKSIIKDRRESTKVNGPFAILQSPFLEN